SWAEEWLEKPVEADEPLDFEPEWIANFRLGYGEALMHLGKNDHARKQFDTALEISREAGSAQSGSAQLEAKILRACGELAWSRGFYDEAMEFCNSGLLMLNEVEDIGGECRLYGVKGNAYFSQGHYDQAIESFQRKLELARKIGDHL